MAFDNFVIPSGSTPDSLERRRRIAEALMMQGMDTSPVGHWTQGAARMAQALMGGYTAGVADKRERENADYSAGLLKQYLGGGDDDVAVSGGTEGMTSDKSKLVGALQGKVPAFAAQGVSPTYFGNMARGESGGNDAAVNTKSGAAGRYQFLPSTWAGLARTMPDLGLTSGGIKDPDQQEKAMVAFTNQNAAALKQGGLPVNDATLAIAHQQGAGGARALLGNPGLNVVDALTPAYKGNRALAMKAVVNNGGDPRMTAGEFAQKVASHYIKGSQPPDMAGGGGQATMTGGDRLRGGSQRDLMAALADPRLDDRTRQILMLEYQRRQKDTGVSTVDLGNAVGVMDRSGNVVRTIPKQTSTEWKEGKDANGGSYFYNPKDPTQRIDGAAPGEAPAKDVTELRREIQQLPSYKNAAQAAPIYKSMVDAASRNSRASDLNLVYGLGKIMDPTSVVREGEMIMVKNTAGLPDWLVGQINAINGGAALTPETRRAVMQEAYSRMQSYNDTFGQDANFYRGIIQRRRMREEDVIPNFGEFKPWQPTETKSGAPVPPGLDPAVEAELRRRGLLK